jgi:hypothetical protein
MIPLLAIRSFSAIVERVDLLFLTRVAVATTFTVSPEEEREAPGGCDISPSAGLQVAATGADAGCT